MATIKYPGKHDVMLGRGGESNYHSGNIAFRHMVQKYKERFRLGSRTEKNKIIDEVVQEWRNQIPGGRFVAKKRTDASETVWYDVGNEMAKKRAAKSLAEWTPQVSFGSGGTATTSTARATKRSRGSAGAYSRGASTTSDFSCNSKRKNLNNTVPPLTVNSCTVLNMANAQQQMQLPEQQIRPLSFFQVAPGGTESGSNSRGVNSSSLATATAALDCSESSASEHSNSSIATITGLDFSLNVGLEFSLNQSINSIHHNINDSTNILPIERIRLQIPTAAELATGAFSDDDEKSTQNNTNKTSSRRGRNLRGNNSNNDSLLPNKPQNRIRPGHNYKSMSSNISNIAAPLGMGFSGTKSLLNDLMRGQEVSSTMAFRRGVGVSGTKSLVDDLLSGGEEVASSTSSLGTASLQAGGVDCLLDDLLRGEEGTASSSSNNGSLGQGFQGGGVNTLLNDLLRGEEEASSSVASGSLGTGFSLLEDLLRGDEPSSNLCPL